MHYRYLITAVACDRALAATMKGSVQSVRSRSGSVTPQLTAPPMPGQTFHAPGQTPGSTIGVRSKLRGLCVPALLPGPLEACAALAVKANARIAIQRDKKTSNGVAKKSHRLNKQTAAILTQKKPNAQMFRTLFNYALILTSLREQGRKPLLGKRR